MWGWDRDQEPLDAVVREMNEASGSADGTLCDVTDSTAVSRAWHQADSVGIPRYLVNNAGPSEATPLSYVEGLIHGPGSKAVVTEEWLSLHGDVAEAVVMISSMGAIMGITNWYGTGKAAVAAYACSVAKGRGGKPRANSVGPGLTRTAHTELFGEERAGRVRQVEPDGQDRRRCRASLRDPVPVLPCRQPHKRGVPTGGERPAPLQLHAVRATEPLRNAPPWVADRGSPHSRLKRPSSRELRTGPDLRMRTDHLGQEAAGFSASLVRSCDVRSEAVPDLPAVPARIVIEVSRDL